MGEAKEEKLPNRWIRVIGAILIQMALGSIYAWSIFNKPLAADLGEPSKSLQVLGIFATSLAGFGLFVTVGGKLQDRSGPKNIAMLSGVIYALGYIISSQFTDNIALMYIGYGVLGAGVGIGYSCALSCCVKWFPDKRGLISGLAVAGFGAGTFVFAQVGQFIIDSGSTQAAGLSSAYLYLGLIFLAMVIGGAQLLCDPPTGYCPAGWSPPKTGSGSTAKKQFSPREMVRTKSFIFLWLMFVLSATCGLMMIGNVSNLGQNFEDIYANATPGFDSTTQNVMVTAQVATITGVLAIFNGAGRIVWGMVSDKIGRMKTMKLMFLVQSVILFSAAAFVMSKPLNENTVFIGVTAIVSLEGFCFGGNFALFPPTTAEYFGTKTLGTNYGIVFTSYAVGGVIGGLMPGIIKGGFEWVFIATALGSLVAFGIAWITKNPADSGPVAETTKA
jgi:OFA family oxalate/formate antiporter-like MFS transporter